MKLVEFTVKWSGNYSEEQLKSYEIMYGEDRDLWPKTNDTSLITIDVENIARFNPGEDENYTTVELLGARAYCICLPYEEFKNALHVFGIEIHNFTKNAV